MQQDIYREAMLGENVDPYEITFEIPRAISWDSYFQWRNHDLNTIKDFDMLTAYGEKGSGVYYGLSLNDMLTLLMSLVATNLGLAASEYAINHLCERVVESILMESVLKVFGPGPLTFAAATSVITAFVTAMESYLNLEKKYIIEGGIRLGIMMGISALLSSIAQTLRLYKLHELFGSNSSAYFDSTLRKMSLHEQYYTFFFFDNIITGILETLSASSMGTLSTMLTARVVCLGLAYAMIATNTSMWAVPDLYLPPFGEPAPNIPFLTFWATTLSSLNTSYASFDTAYFSANEVYSKQWPTVFASIPAVLSGLVTRIMTEAPVTNSNTFKNLSPKKGNNNNETGQMKDLDVEGFIMFIGQMSSILSPISSFVQDLRAELKGNLNSDHKEARTGCTSRNDSFMYWKNTDEFYGPNNIMLMTNAVASLNMVYPKDDIKTYGHITFTDPSYNNNTVIWSHVYDGNIFCIPAVCINKRNIEKTIVIKTRNDFGRGLFRGFMCLLKCSNDDTLWLAFERSQIKYHSGQGAMIRTIEQVIDNYNRYNAGDFFSKRSGKITEIWATTFDNHVISYRYNIKYALDTFFNTFVSVKIHGFNRYGPIAYSEYENVPGTLISYENPFM